jgi:outer membrane protein TolC
LTLRDCIALALNESPELEASRLQVTQATEEARAQRDEMLPKITGQAGATLFSGSPTSKFAIVNDNGPVIVPNPNRPDRGDRSVSNATVETYVGQLSYPLFRDGSIFGLNTAPAEASKLARRRNLAWTARLRREEVISRITIAYISTVAAMNRAGYAERRVNLLQRQVDITEEQQKQGLSLPIDLKLAHSQLSGAQTLSKILREQAVAGRIDLAKALGFDSADELHLSNELPVPPEPPSADELLGPGLNEHPQLQAQKALIDEARQDYLLERYRLYPSVNLNGSAVHIDDFGGNSAEVYSGTVNVNVPIFDFGAQMHTTRGKLAKFESERAQLGAVAHDLSYRILLIYQSIYVLSQNILSLEDEVAKANRDWQIISSQQQQGISTPLTAIEKELHYIAKRDDLEGQRVRRLELYSELQKAAGGAWKWIQ